MSGREILGSYLADVEKRLRLVVCTRGFAVVAGIALAATIGLVLAADRVAFSSSSVLAARVGLVLAIAAAIAAGMAIPLRRLNRRRAARRVERQYPQFEQRLLTFAEKESADDPFLELLAADAAEVARQTNPTRFAPRPVLAGFAAAGVLAVSVLVWLVGFAPGSLGHGAALLWGATGRTGPAPFYEIAVQPGDATVRKGGNQVIRAAVRGIDAGSARIHARFASASKWEEAAMLPRESGGGFEFLFASLAEPVEYYVTSGKLASRHFRLTVVDLPAVKRIRVTYRYPAWLNVREAAPQEGGDLRAVAGTEADLTIETDRPLANGVLVLDGTRQVKLDATAGNQARGKVLIEKDGLYHVAAVDSGATVRLTEDFFIEAQAEKPPAVAVRRPGRDARVSPIEEVVVAVEAEDDFALEAMDLRYSVNGAPEKTVALLKGRGGKQAQGETMLALEDYKLAPGDIIALYATARDARSTSKSDIYFLEAQPWEREVTQSQVMGGGGGESGEGNQPGRISERQKEIIAATWNQSRDAGRNRAEAAGNARFLADVQAKLRDQAQTLARRMRSRELAVVNQEFSSFSKGMDEAAADMTTASEKLKAQNWREALPAEQRALQHLLRAEATFRQIQVAFGSRGGGGGGSGSGRDLENMVDLELDLEKNQYEAGQQRASADQRQREIDEALQRLEQLARRQQELASRQSRQQQQSPEQRWQQEMLRREAEQLQQRMEQLARDSGGQRSPSGSPTRERLDRMAGRGSSPAGDRRIQEALDRLQQAQEDMRRAAQNGQSATDSRRAAERLEEARRLVGVMRQQEASGQLDDLARRAAQLADEQRAHAEELRRMFGQPDGQGQRARSDLDRIVSEKERMLEELREIEKDMQTAARDLAGTERQASSKVREALGDVQQDEIATRMRFNREYLRRGWGQSTWMREAPVTAGLERLRQRLRDARAAAGGQPREQGNLEESLARVERLRGRLEQPSGRAYREGLRQLRTIGEGFRDDPETAREVRNAIREIERLDPGRFPGNPQLVEGLRAQTLATVEQIEILLRRKLDEQRSSQVRSAAGERIPPGYGAAVAEYYRRLSKSK